MKPQYVAWHRVASAHCELTALHHQCLCQGFMAEVLRKYRNTDTDDALRGNRVYV